MTTSVNTFSLQVTAQDFLLYGIDKIVDKETSPVTRRSVIYVNATVSAEFECEAVNKHIEGTTAVTKKTYLYVKPPNGEHQLTAVCFLF